MASSTSALSLRYVHIREWGLHGEIEERGGGRPQRSSTTSDAGVARKAHSPATNAYEFQTQDTNKAGFTLLEVIVALAILGIGVAVAMQIFAGGFANVHRINQAQRAMEHAENVMNEILSDRGIGHPVRLGGDLDEDFSYTAVVEYWDEPREQLSIQHQESSIVLLSIAVDIHFKGDPHGRLYRAVSLKSVFPDEEAEEGGGSLDVIQRLFGGN